MFIFRNTFFGKHFISKYSLVFKNIFKKEENTPPPPVFSVRQRWYLSLGGGRYDYLIITGWLWACSPWLPTCSHPKKNNSSFLSVNHLSPCLMTPVLPPLHWSILFLQLLFCFHPHKSLLEAFLQHPFSSYVYHVRHEPESIDFDFIYNIYIFTWRFKFFFICSYLPFLTHSHSTQNLAQNIPFT